MTIDEIQSALRFDMDMMLFDPFTGKTDSKESLKYGNEMNYIHYCAEEQAIELLEELKAMRNLDKTNFSDGYNKAIAELPTAYNIDKVVEELEELKHYNLCLGDAVCDIQENGINRHFVCLEDAIEIVKAGVENDIW